MSEPGKTFGPYKGVKTIDLTGYVDTDFVATPSDRDTVEVELYGFEFMIKTIEVKQLGKVLVIRRQNTSEKRTLAKRTIVGDKVFECMDGFVDVVHLLVPKGIEIKH